MSQAELFEMNEDEYYNILIEEQRKEPSDAEIINSYNNDIEAVINEMRAFHDSYFRNSRK
jgi:broad specificity phosphatase PhoE